MKNRKTNLAISLLMILGFVFVLSSCTYEDNTLKQDENSLKPMVLTGDVMNNDVLTAYSGGIILFDGGSDIIQRGVCWSLSPNPTIKDSLTLDAAGTGEFTSKLTGLEPSTTYYVRAYATNKTVTVYGLQVIYTTPVGVLKVTTSPVTTIFESSSTSGGTFSYDSGSLPATFGVCWSKSSNPTISLATKTVDSLNMYSYTNSFRSVLTELEPSTTYYVRAYATNNLGTFYGNNVSFTTLTPAQPVVDIDGNIYHSIRIGTQVWTVENLKTTKYNDGTSIPNLTDNAQWTSTATGAYCNYDNNEENVTTYGRLYNWFAVKDSRKIAPVGWHIPSDDEWQIMINYLGGDNYAYGKLKEAGTTHWTSPNSLGTNESGFSALPAGNRVSYGEFARLGEIGIWWTATQYYDSYYAWRRSLTYNEYYVSQNANEKNFGFSVRCVKDETNN